MILHNFLENESHGHISLPHSSFTMEYTDCSLKECHLKNLIKSINSLLLLVRSTLQKKSELEGPSQASFFKVYTSPAADTNYTRVQMCQQHSVKLQLMSGIQWRFEYKFQYFLTITAKVELTSYIVT